LALNAHGDLFVADLQNNRVLEYAAPLTSGMPAQRVFGQGGSFTSTLPNRGGIGPGSLAQPAGLALDAAGNLFVADNFNSRVLEFDTPLSSDTMADRVLGQTDMFTNTYQAALGRTTLHQPIGLAVDGQDDLFVVDNVDNRVLEFDSVLTSDKLADLVLGEADFGHSDAYLGGPTAANLYQPYDLALDRQGNLFVADTGFARALEYDAPLSTHEAAARVFGQTSFFTDTLGLSRTQFGLPIGVALDAHGNLYLADYAGNRVTELDRPLPLLDLFLPLIQR
jgi:DNA-binding beta-propeller fold protein YncE